MTDRQVDPNTDQYSAKLLKLIPSEVTAAYLSINSMVSVQQGFDSTIISALVILTIMCPLYLWKLQGVRSYLQIVFTTAAFPLWALNISAPRDDFLTSNSQLLGVILILATLVIPLLPTDKGT
jgi:hypothetical protein